MLMTQEAQQINFTDLMSFFPLDVIIYAFYVCMLSVEQLCADILTDLSFSICELHFLFKIFDHRFKFSDRLFLSFNLFL